MSQVVIGWVGAYISPYEQAPLSESRKQALIECIRKRRYNFTYQAHQTLPYCAPIYTDRKLCVLTKPQWDEIMEQAYTEMRYGDRKTPLDVLNDMAEDILYENKKYMKKGDENDG